MKLNIKFYIRHIICILIFFLIPLMFTTASGTLENDQWLDRETISQIDIPQGDSTNIDPIPKEPQNVVIVVDAGHGGSETGAICEGIYEKNINLDISLRYGKMLENEGLNVVYTRKTDKFVELKDRANIANSINATLFISIHNNELPGNSDYRGSETLYAKSFKADENNKPINGEKLATIVQGELVNSLKMVDNGTIYRPNLAVLRRTSMPAVIAEIGYMSNSSDRAKLLTNDFKYKAALALKNATIKALEKMKAFKDSNGKWKV